MEYTTGALGVVVPVGGEKSDSAGGAAPAAVAPAVVPRAVVLPALVAGRALPLARATVAVGGGGLALRALGRVGVAVAALALGRRRAEVAVEAGGGLPGAG